MGYTYLDNIELETGLETYIEWIKAFGSLLKVEEIPVQTSFGYITSEAVIAKISSPHYNASAMDGIVLKASATFGATETTPVTLTEGRDFIRVDTGDAVPVHFDSVVMIEEVIELGKNEIKLHQAVTPWQHIRQIGEDICANEMIIPSNTRITPSMIGAMLAGGVLQVKVWQKATVGIIPTGDEIVSPTNKPKAGEIIEFNSSIFSAMLKSWGVEVIVYDIVPDRMTLLKAAITTACSECEIVLINAGSSAGREDFTSGAIDSLGKVFIHGIAIKPGKPTILGAVGGKPVIGIPGYPVSGIIVMEQIVKKLIESLNNMMSIEDVGMKAVLSKKLVSSLKYKEFIRVKLGEVDGKFIATPLNRGAGVVTSFVKADAILEVPMNVEGIEAGSEVEVKLLKSVEELTHTLVLIGSHDPLIDVIADIIRRNYKNEFISSAHVGSLGGLMAIKRGEAHISGIHLLDEKTGDYNRSYIEKYLGKGNTCQLKGVKRTQGLMVKKDNPKGINTLMDICKLTPGGENLRYVNRQKGSGTRILLDYLLHQENIKAEAICGYEREEFTHMSVAAIVSSDSADAGMGIYAVAKTFDLDFIPLYEEQYDFIIPEKFIEKKEIKDFIEVMKSEEFKVILKEMGGYTTEDCGEISLI